MGGEERGGSRPADVPGPSALMTTPEQIQQQLAYEWLDSAGVSAGMRNPPFLSGTAGRLHPALIDSHGMSARILRGYIRRANTVAGDPVTQARLYFMYNPEQIVRNYASYLDQGALDPFNTLFQSGNLVAPPSFMDFSFELIFDRQTEAMSPSHPGVFVDYQFFDMVVRNVIPTDPNASTNNQLPDNGVMMINPMDITVVFSPQLSVQGRPITGSVVFEKFTHEMVPVRMRITLTMRAVYFGPVLTQSEYRMEQESMKTAAYVPPKEEFTFTFTFSDLIVERASMDAATAGANAGAAAGAAGAGANLGPEGANIVPVAGITGGLDRGLAPIATRMIADAARAGITIGGGGYRGSAAQADLRRKNGCPDLTSPSSTCRVPTAPLVNGKSKSEHTKGLAIDVSNCDRGSAKFNWLKANAARYGLKNLPSESWHWSTTGK